jgi:hypothetical protein
VPGGVPSEYASARRAHAWIDLRQDSDRWRWHCSLLHVRLFSHLAIESLATSWAGGGAQSLRLGGGNWTGRLYRLNSYAGQTRSDSVTPTQLTAGQRAAAKGTRDAVQTGGLEIDCIYYIHEASSMPHAASGARAIACLRTASKYFASSTELQSLPASCGAGCWPRSRLRPWRGPPGPGVARAWGRNPILWRTCALARRKVREVSGSGLRSPRNGTGLLSNS